MDKISIEMSQYEYKKYLAYKEADKITRSIRQSLDEVQEVRNGKRNIAMAI